MTNFLKHPAFSASPIKTAPGEKSQRRTSLTEGDGTGQITGAPTMVVRVTLASIEECNILLQNGLDFYGATFFPTELAMSPQAARLAKPSRLFIIYSLRFLLFQSVTFIHFFRVTGGSISARVRDLLPVFDNAGFAKLPPPAMKMIKPKGK